jgi:hypothetical protein
MSARSITVGPAPLRSTPTTPVLPTLRLTSYPKRSIQSAATLAVRTSCIDSSGCWCKSLYTASSSGSSVAILEASAVVSGLLVSGGSDAT